jgi:hypothetical protein
VKCGGNVHDLGVVEITSSSVSNTETLRNAVSLGDLESSFYSEDEPGQWICFDFKTVRIEPTHYTIRAGYDEQLKSWAVEGSDDGDSWTEIDRRENNSDLNSEFALKTFAILQSVSFRRIRLRQTGPNHDDDNSLVLSAFELFGAVAGLPDDFVKFCFPTVPVFPFTWAPFNGIISYLTVKCGGNVHDLGVVEITSSSVFNTYSPRNAVSLGDMETYFYSKDEPGQWICLAFKAVRIEPTHYTIWSDSGLQSWAVEGSDDGDSWTEIDRRENNSDLNGEWALKTFAISQSESFERIRLRQTGPNHDGDNYLQFSAFKVFGAVAGLQ